MTYILKYKSYTDCDSPGSYQIETMKLNCNFGGALSEALELYPYDDWCDQDRFYSLTRDGEPLSEQEQNIFSEAGDICIRNNQLEADIRNLKAINLSILDNDIAQAIKEKIGNIRADILKNCEELKRLKGIYE